MGLTVYKFTDTTGMGGDGRQWGAGVTHTTTGEYYPHRPEQNWLLCEHSPLTAALLGPIHDGANYPVLWRAEVTTNAIEPHGGRLMVTGLTTIEDVPVPVVTATQRVAFAILCTLADTTRERAEWNRWAGRWLSGADRSRESAARVTGTAISSAGENAAGAAAAAAVGEVTPLTGMELATIRAIHAVDSTQLSRLKYLALAEVACAG